MNMFTFFHKKSKEATPEPLFFTTDIHSHICPGIDDGASTPEDSVNLVREMADLGLQKMIVTPHVTEEVFPNNTETINKSAARLKKALKENGIDMRLQFSAEYRIDDLFFSYLEKKTLRPLPNDYILVECPWISEPFGLEAFLKQLVARYGLKPILAHPERYPYYLDNHERYEHIRRSGVRFQINLLSLAGYYGRTIKQMGEHLLENRMVEFIGTDLHHHRHVECIRRYLASDDYRLLKAQSSNILNDVIFYDAPDAPESI